MTRDRADPENLAAHPLPGWGRLAGPCLPEGRPCPVRHEGDRLVAALPDAGVRIREFLPEGRLP